MSKPVTDTQQTIDRTRRLIAEMREVIEDARLSVLAARDILKRFPGSEELGPAATLVEPSVDDPPDDSTLRLVDILLEAHGAANLDDDAEVRALLETALLRVGHRLARRAGPRAAGLVLQ